jgi:hypothetical protein
MTQQIYLSGRLKIKPEVRKTKSDRDWCKILVEFNSTREVRPGGFVSETTIVPINCFARCAEQVKGLKPYDQLTVGCRITGTRFKADDDDRFGVQLVAEQVFLAAIAREEAI